MTPSFFFPLFFLPLSVSVFVKLFIFKYLTLSQGHFKTPRKPLTACFFIYILGSRDLCAPPHVLFYPPEF